jgi:hypothetical protein
MARSSRSTFNRIGKVHDWGRPARVLDRARLGCAIDHLTTVLEKSVRELMRYAVIVLICGAGKLTR